MCTEIRAYLPAIWNSLRVAVIQSNGVRNLLKCRLHSQKLVRNMNSIDQSLHMQVLCVCPHGPADTLYLARAGTCTGRHPSLPPPSLPSRPFPRRGRGGEASTETTRLSAEVAELERNSCRCFWTITRHPPMRPSSVAPPHPAPPHLTPSQRGKQTTLSASTCPHGPGPKEGGGGELKG